MSVSEEEYHNEEEFPLFEFEEDEEEEEGDFEESKCETEVSNYRTTLYEHEKAIFDAMSDEDFLIAIESIEADRLHLSLENRVFENFLNANEPTLLSGLHMAKATVQELQEIYPLMPNGYQAPGPIPGAAKATLFSEKGHRINISQKTDLVARDVEDMQIRLDAFNEAARKKKFRLRAEIEESAIRLQEIKESRDQFEQQIVIEAVDPLTQRIPAEKFILFMQDWYKSKGLQTEKLRLRNSSLSAYYTKIKALLAQKIELGESIHEVDFEQLKIENRHLLEKIEQKNTHLIELKKLTGKANLNLATNKNYLHKIMNMLKTIKTSMEETVAEKQQHEKDIVRAEKEVQEAKQRYIELKELIDNYRVPSILDYVKLKAKIYDLKKDIRILKRKENILTIILNSNIQMMKKLTGAKKPKSWWFEKQEEGELDEFDETEELHLSGSKLMGSSNSSDFEFDIFTVLQK